MISRIVSLINYSPSIFKYYSHNPKRCKSSRPEQKKLRNYLENNKEKKCIICQKNLPHYVLECAHIKPRSVCNFNERYDFNVVNWMCRNCHIIFDRGGIGVMEGELLISKDIECFLDFEPNFKEEEFYMANEYYRYHFNKIFKK